METGRPVFGVNHDRHLAALRDSGLLDGWTLRPVRTVERITVKRVVGIRAGSAGRDRGRAAPR